ncbi:hypothetical protein A3A79_01235 [Candidatus Gottesmanbacteria bacterium RIFCSPLOWO2_01_FULL_43_11b]|uniref:Phosphatidic acid phosphatase type 2/haloperoxidase domain-containing protein n=1 Tax=Candidatus Gottesmanbacteria bacterium RIFCSPLOWO2_01_FULL_43_11b TaxID=1798392 RepID=A0A1F6AHD9_9BACT|nr:MAG: hypothetical protein A3A79_01235 [Candidatus Gottesmanbacteria bacterium RIFCSPLOWO2_01_FULL_43_11b]
MVFLASFISRLFEPMLVLYALSIIGGFRSNLIASQLSFYILYISIFFGAIFIFKFFIMLRLKTDWDIRERKKRILPLLVLLAVTIGNFFLIRTWNNEILINLFILFFIWFLGFFLITLKYKISGHVGIATLAAGVVTQWFGWWQVFLMIPLIAWARVETKNHTVLQVILGAIYSWMLVMFTSSI